MNNRHRRANRLGINLESIIAGITGFTAASNVVLQEGLPRAQEALNSNEPVINYLSNSGINSASIAFSAAAAYGMYELGRRNMFSRAARRVMRAGSTGIRAGARAAARLDNVMCSAYNRLHERPVNANVSILPRSGILGLQLVSYLSIPIMGYAALTNSAPDISPSQPQIPAPVVREVSEVPKPVPIATPKPKTQEEIIAEQKRNFMIRLLYGESGNYDPINNRARGYTAVNYNNAYFQHLINILNVIDNRSKDSANFPGQNDWVRASLVPWQFSVVAMQENEDLYFKREVPSGFWKLPMPELLSYLNTEPIGNNELANRWAGKPQKVSLASQKLDKVKEAVDTYMNEKRMNELMEQGKLEEVLPLVVSFYKNSSATNEVWDGKCLGNSTLSFFKHDPSAIKDGYTHTFYGIAGPCSALTSRR